MNIFIILLQITFLPFILSRTVDPLQRAYASLERKFTWEQLIGTYGFAETSGSFRDIEIKIDSLVDFPKFYNDLKVYVETHDYYLRNRPPCSLSGSFVRFEPLSTDITAGDDDFIDDDDVSEDGQDSHRVGLDAEFDDSKEVEAVRELRKRHGNPIVNSLKGKRAAVKLLARGYHRL